jgi:hypothetical protein
LVAASPRFGCTIGRKARGVNDWGDICGFISPTVEIKEEKEQCRWNHFGFSEPDASDPWQYREFWHKKRSPAWWWWTEMSTYWKN